MAKKINSLGDILQRKADDLEDSGIKDDISLIQQELDRNFSGEVKIERFQDDGILVVKTSSSSMASEVRLRQYAIIQNLTQTIKNKLVRFRIIIG